MNVTLYLFITIIAIVGSSANDQPTPQMDKEQMQQIIANLPKTFHLIDLNSRKTALHKYRKVLPYYIKQLLKDKEDQLILDMVRKFIQVERVGRYQICLRAFGGPNCSLKALHSPRPFFMWKKQLVQNLIGNPAKDVLHLLKKISKSYEKK